MLITKFPYNLQYNNILKFIVKFSYAWHDFIEAELGMSSVKYIIFTSIFLLLLLHIIMFNMFNIFMFN